MEARKGRWEEDMGILGGMEHPEILEELFDGCLGDDVERNPHQCVQGREQGNIGHRQ
jgi:hypothetical protein